MATSDHGIIATSQVWVIQAGAQSSPEVAEPVMNGIGGDLFLFNPMAWGRQSTASGKS
jgi:hypothetical protein